MAIDLAELGLKVRSDGVVVATDRLDKMGRAAGRAESASMRLQRQADKTGQAMKKLGRNLSLYVTAPMLAIAGASTKAAADFNSTLAKMNTLVGVSREEIAAFRGEVLKMAGDVGRGPIELANALFAVTSAGQRGAQALDTLNKAAKASAIGLGDTRTVALTATAAVQAYGEANMSSTKALEILIGTVEQGNLAAEELSPVLGRVIGIASQMGVAFEDLGAFIAVFTRLGVKADEATTALRGTLGTILTPTEEAIDAFKQMGLSIDEVRRSIRERGFIVTFQEIVQAAKRTNTDLAVLVPNIRALSGVMGVFGGDGKLAVEVLENVAAAVGTMEERFEALKELDPTFAFDALKADIQSVAIEIGATLLPSVLEITTSIRDMLKAFKELDPETQKTIIGVGLLTATFGPFLIVLGSLIRTFPILLGMLKNAAWLLSPAGALLVGLTALMVIIGKKYVDSINDAVAGTNRYVGSLRELKEKADAAAMALNLLSVNENIVHNLRQQAELQERINDMPLGINVDRFQEDMAQLERELRNLLRLRQELEEGIMTFTEVSVPAEAYEKMARMQQALADLLAELASKNAKVDPEAYEDLAEAMEAIEDATNPAAKELRNLAKIRRDLDKAFKIGDVSLQEFERWNAELDLRQAQLGMKEMDVLVQQNLAHSFEYVEGLEAMKQELDSLRGTIDPVAAQLEQLAKMRELVNKAFKETDFIGSQEELDAWLDAIDRFEKSVLNAGEAFRRTTEMLLFGLDSLARSAEEGSSAQRAFAIAAEIANAVLAAQAVLTQGGGDPYTAFARMAAMAGIVANLGYAVGSISSSGASTLAADRQAQQGTGSVLGDMEAKTESILNATETTADATSELVGINRGMLHALQSLQAGISGAVVRLARGSGDVDFGAAPGTGWFDELFFGTGIFDMLGLNFLGDFLQDIFGGSVDLVDEGIKILGGPLDELAEEVLVQAFRAFNVKKHIFDDTDLETQFQDLGEDVSTQFALVFGSIRDTVTEAALALGIPLAEIEQRIAEFEIATIEISFKDLTAEEQREELLAVFGKVFDELARDVIPFIDQFQQVGEGLGETLVRVATSVQVFQEAIGALGLTVNETDPELFAQMAVGIVELTGGVENFIAQFTTFFDKFASDEQKLEFITSQLTRGFEAVGLVIPDTRDGMIDLMMSLDATTEAGRRQIATVLELAGVADEYYSLLESAEADRLEAAELEAAAAARLLEQAQLIADFVGLGAPSQLVQLTDRFNEAMEAADALGASQREYAMIARSFNLQLQRMAAELTISILSMAKRLFGVESQGLGEEVNDGLEEVRLVSNRLFQDWLRALEDIYEFTQSILLDEQLTTLTPAEQFAEAQSQFNRLLAAARAGDVEAAAALPDAAQALLEEARFMFASGAQYQKVFDATLAALESVKMPSGIPEFLEETVGGGGQSEPDLRTEQERMWDDMIESLERFLLATDLATALRDLSMVLDTSVIQLAEQLGVPLRELVTILGVELGNLNEGTAAALANVAQLLGADIYELIAALDIGLRELAVASGVHLDEMSKALVGELKRFADMLGVDVLGLATQLNISIADLAETFGLGIKEFKASQFTALVEFSNALGKGVGEVARELKINLGDIRDATSLLSEALDQAIRELPAAIQADLGPLLEAIREATTLSDSNAAISNLGDYILGLPDDLSASLLPFLELIGFKPGTPEVTALNSIDRNTADTVAAVDRVNRTLKGTKDYTPVKGVFPTKGSKDKGVLPTGPGTKGILGSFAHGGTVPETGMYQLHAREFVVNPQRDNIVVNAPDNTLTREELAQIRTVLEDIRSQSREYQKADLATSRGIESSMKQQAEQQRRKANG